jgi:hypothetical protein
MFNFTSTDCKNQTQRLQMNVINRLLESAYQYLSFGIVNYLVFILFNFITL